jgi:hypothetical protein
MIMDITTIILTTAIAIAAAGKVVPTIVLIVLPQQLRNLLP